MNAFAPWQNFYVIVGSSAGALIGLQFVVLTLITGRSNVTLDANAGAAYTTPTIVHFGTVLLLSAIIAVPWQTSVPIAALWGAIGALGAAYMAVVTRRLRRPVYKPQFEDWLFHALLPLAAYVTILSCALAMTAAPNSAPFGVAAAALLLLFTGIHNAWDIVTYHVFADKPHNPASK